eukprot:1150842-Pelagomonas_calceolata.AAC.13
MAVRAKQRIRGAWRIPTGPAGPSCCQLGQLSSVTCQSYAPHFMHTGTHSTPSSNVTIVLWTPTPHHLRLPSWNHVGSEAMAMLPSNACIYAVSNSLQPQHRMNCSPLGWQSQYHKALKWQRTCHTRQVHEGPGQRAHSKGFPCNKACFESTSSYHTCL